MTAIACDFKCRHKWQVQHSARHENAETRILREGHVSCRSFSLLVPQRTGLALAIVRVHKPRVPKQFQSMSSLTPDDPGSSDLPPNVLSALRDAVEREGPLDSQALQGLTPLAQQEILAHQGQLQQAASPAESAEVLDQTQRRLGEVVRNDAQLTTSSPASAEAPGPHTTSEPGPANFGRAGSELGNAQQVPSRPRGAQATAQAQAPVFTEGSDGTSPYKPPAGQRITRTLPNSRFQSSQRLPQVKCDPQRNHSAIIAPEA